MRSIVWLTSADEALRVTGRDLRAEYLARGFDCALFPIPDFGTPDRFDEVGAAIDMALAHLRAGEGVLVHCLAGIGRTGLFLACLIGRVSPLSGSECIRWVRRSVSGAVESDEQREFVASFLAAHR